MLPNDVVMKFRSRTSPFTKRDACLLVGGSVPPGGGRGPLMILHQDFVLGGTFLPKRDARNASRTISRPIKCIGAKQIFSRPVPFWQTLIKSNCTKCAGFHPPSPLLLPGPNRNKENAFESKSRSLLLVNRQSENM